MKKVLKILAKIYLFLIQVRLWLYQKSIWKSYRPDVFVISVGNLSVGGTGKTPIVNYLTQSLLQQNKKVAILTRGYGSKHPKQMKRVKFSENANPFLPQELGDEPYFLAIQHPNVVIYSCKNRKKSAKLADKNDSVDVLILDDGYQHLALQRDLNLLLIDSQKQFGNKQVLPLGQLREPIQHCSRADAIFLTKSSLGNTSDAISCLPSEIQHTKPLFVFDYQPSYLLHQQTKISLEELKDKKVVASCGIANAEQFEVILLRLGMKVLHFWELKDHVVYKTKMLDLICQQKEKLQADFWITTEKDAVKLQTFPKVTNQYSTLVMQVIPDKKWDFFFAEYLKSY